MPQVLVLWLWMVKKINVPPVSKDIVRYSACIDDNVMNYFQSLVSDEYNISEVGLFE